MSYVSSSLHVYTYTQYTWDVKNHKTNRKLSESAKSGISLHSTLHISKYQHHCNRGDFSMYVRISCETRDASITLHTSQTSQTSHTSHTQSPSISFNTITKYDWTRYMKNVYVLVSTASMSAVSYCRMIPIIVSIYRNRICFLSNLSVLVSFLIFPEHSVHTNICPKLGLQ